MHLIDLFRLLIELSKILHGLFILALAIPSDNMEVATLLKIRALQLVLRRHHSPVLFRLSGLRLLVLRQVGLQGLPLRDRGLVGHMMPVHGESALGEHGYDLLAHHQALDDHGLLLQRALRLRVVGDGVRGPVAQDPAPDHVRGDVVALKEVGCVRLVERLLLVLEV